MSKPQITEQANWLSGALEIQRQTAGKRTKRSYATQDHVDRMIRSAPHVRRIQVLAERRDVLRFATADGERLVYRGREIVPVRYADPLRPWAGVVPV